MFKFILRLNRYNILKDAINETLKGRDSMKIKNIVAILLVVIVSSVASSVATIKMLKTDNGMLNTSVKMRPINVINDGGTKSQNVYQAVAQKASPSVVGIVSERVYTNSLTDTKNVETGSGTGFVVDKRGYILTNAHVVSNGQVKNVNVIYSDGTSTKGNVIWFDNNLDLAIVKVEKNGLVPAELGNSDNISVGDIAIAIGNPFGTDLMSTVTQGIISGYNRDVSSETVNMSGLIQTDASINPGNSGGPLLNKDGQVIGINTVKARADNLGFSIPINTAKVIIQRVIEDGNYKKPLLGISGIDVRTFTMYTGTKLDVDNGIVIRTVQSGTIAAKAGIKPGDIIVEIGKTKIKNMGDISKKIYSYSKGSSDEVQIIRNGKKISLKIQF